MNPDVVINGVRYTPADPDGGELAPKIGVGITTRNRPDVFQKAYKEILRLTPEAKIVVVDDASTKPVPEATFRFDKNVGIARAKNKCLELLDDCEHIFLFDDDVYPLVNGWWEQYVESPEPHLMWVFQKKVAGVGDDPGMTYKDSRHVAYAGPRGQMLYAERRVLDTVGGFDTRFGKYGFEHVDWSNRINSAGLTTWRYTDIVGSDELFYSFDLDNKVKSSTPETVQKEAEASNRALHDAQKCTAAYRPYKEQRDVVVTTLMTRQVDPARNKRMQSSSNLLAALKKSLHGSLPLVVLHDELKDADTPQVQYVKVDSMLQPYFQRWVSIWQWLRDNPDVRYVWCVDGTDVEMLRNPVPDMELGKLYVGSETTVVGMDWMVKQHTSKVLQSFISEHKDLTLLNAGLVGGDRATVMAFVHDVIQLFDDNAADIHFKRETNDLGLGDMATLNLVGYTKYRDKLVFGPKVNTVFKANERTPWSWWKHK